MRKRRDVHCILIPRGIAKAATPSLPIPLASALAMTLSLGVARPALALDVIGNLNMDTTWKQSDSPVRLTGDVTVQPKVTLTIEPGTIVEAATTDGLGSGTDPTKVEFIIKGALVANGTATNRITIHGAAAGPGVWYGLSFQPGAKESSVTFLDLSDANIGIYSRTTSSLTLSDFSVSSSNTGLFWQTTPGPTLTRAQILNSASVGMLLSDDGSSGAQATLNAVTVRNTAGSGLVLSSRVGATVNGSTFVNNQIGIDAQAGSALDLTNSLVFFNLQLGLQLNQTGSNVFSIFNNTIDLNTAYYTESTAPGEGIKVTAVSDASNFIIRNNNITNHGTLGIDVGSGVSSPSLDHNNVWGNATNYSMGITGGTGAISTNPLYRGLGSPATGAAFSHLNYPNNDSYTFNCSSSDPNTLASYVAFSAFSTESGFDKVTILDGSGTVRQTLSGNLGSFNTVYVQGGALQVRFTSDGSDTSTGFSGTCMYLSWQSNYRLQASSPAIDVGNNLDAPTTDFDGVTRPVDGDFDGTATVDIGAFEWHSNLSPVANAGTNQLVLENTTVNFDGRASYDSDGTVVSYSWDFGDGSALGSGAQVSHIYTALGTYTVKLTVTDDEGATGSNSITVTVVNNLPPIANAGGDQKVAPGDTVTLDGSGSYDPDGTVVGYAWDFGDGTPPGSGRTVTHVYAAAGTYKATLTVTDNKGATGANTAVITVGDGGSMGMDGGATMGDGGATMEDGGTTERDGGTGTMHDGGTHAQDGSTSGGEDAGADGSMAHTPVRDNGPVIGCGCDIAGGAEPAQTASLAAFLGIALLLGCRRFLRRFSLPA